MLAQAVGLLLFAEVSPTGSYFADVLTPSLLVAVFVLRGMRQARPAGELALAETGR